VIATHRTVGVPDRPARRPRTCHPVDEPDRRSHAGAAVDPVSLTAYAAYPPEPNPDRLGRVAHLSDADLALVRRRTSAVMQLGYAVRLATVWAIGTFCSDAWSGISLRPAGNRPRTA
jgi:hypothetical protein